MNNPVGGAPVVATSELRLVGVIIVAVFLVVIVGATVISLTMKHAFHSDTTDLPTGGANIDANKLREEAFVAPTPQATPGVLHLQMPDMLNPVATPKAAQTPAPKAQKSALQIWREQEALKAAQAPIMVAAFQLPNNTQEIPSKTLSQLKPALSPFTVIEGTHITAALKQMVNSDYPGDVTAEVRQPIFDSATGKIPLIPFAATLIGKFESPSGPISERVAIKWHRIVFPDMSSLDLADAPTSDEQGVAGATGDVDGHYMQKIGAATALTLLSIGPAIGSVLATNSNNNNNGNSYNPDQELTLLMAGAAGSRASSQANQWLGPYLNRSKTVVLTAGQLIDVFLNKDLILPGPYRDAAGVTSLPSASNQ